MLRVRMYHAKPGMVLAMPVYHPRHHGTVLLRAGVALEEHVIERLREINLREIWIRYPGMAFVAEYISPGILDAHARVTGRIAEAFDLITCGAHASLDYGRYRWAIGAMMKKVLANPRAAIFVSELVEQNQPALRHASNVCFLSLLMGLKLEDYLVAERSRLTAWNARDVTNLGVGAMMHDIGMLRLAPEVLERWNATHDQSDPEWRQHVFIGYEMVKGGIGPTAAAAVLHHHQHYDGSGFPHRRLLNGSEEPYAGKEIHVFARIIAAADIFDRVRYGADAPGAEVLKRPQIPTVRALRRMQQRPFRDWIDPMVYKALLAVVPAYTPGSIVTLSSGQTGVVVEWFPDDPCRPTVQEIDLLEATEPFDDRPRPRHDLRHERDLTIVEAEGEDVSGDNFYPPYPGAFDLRLAGKGLINKAAGIRPPGEAA